MKGFIQELHGDVGVLTSVGFDDSVEERSPIDQLKEYIQSFNLSGKKVHNEKTTEFTLIMDQFAHGIFDKEEVEKARREAYQMASEEIIAAFFFTQCPGEYIRRRDIIAACVINNDIDRAIALIDMMASTKGNKGYNDRNGWGRQNMLTVKYLIQLFAYSQKGIIGEEAIGITDSMRETVLQLVERMLSNLPLKSQEELTEDLHELEPPESKEHSNALDNYVKQLLDEVDAYTTFVKTRKRGKSFDINKVNWNIMQCFGKLSDAGRVDVIIQIMQKLSEVHDSLIGVTYHFHVLNMVKEIKANDFSMVYNYNPEILEIWISDPKLKDNQILAVAKEVGKYCSETEFMSFRNMIVLNKGYVEGLDSCFKGKSKKKKTQMLYNGDNVTLQLKRVEIVEHCPGASDNRVANVILHLLTAKKSDLVESVRVTSCKINGIETNDLGFICDFDDGGPNIGYDIEALDGVDELTVYPDFFQDNGIKHVSKIELALVLMDHKVRIVEKLTPIVIEHSMEFGGYVVTKKAKRKV